MKSKFKVNVDITQGKFKKKVFTIQRDAKRCLYYFKIISLILIIIISFLNASEKPTPEKEKEKAGTSFKQTKKEKAEITTKILKYPKKVLKFIKKKEWYKYKDKNQKIKKGAPTPIRDEADLSLIKKGASDEMESIFVLLGEIPMDGKRTLLAPVFLTEKKNIFGTKTNFSLKWAGYKTTLSFKQKKFPWKKTMLRETFIASFLYASGTNLGFNRKSLLREKRFYTNYTSQIISLKHILPMKCAIVFTLDSRQYFFIKRKTPDNFIMPINHINIFPRIDLRVEHLKERGLDQLSKGIQISSWIGYGIRNRWEKWGDPSSYNKGEATRKFVIYSIAITSGLLYKNNHNLVLKSRFKGGLNNDFLSLPRFGGTIDNAKLDVVHGFTLDEFRVKRFGLLNLKYSFNISKHLRMNLFFDYAHIFSATSEDILGSGYGLRIIFLRGLPIWIIHGIGKKYYPEKRPIQQVIMIMTAIGW